MNKDVIYIEPEDDITDILSKLKESKHKIVALVPPKKASVLRSAVNFKLIAKTARRAEKTVVLVTTDASLMKLAAAIEMPVAKSLQSKPTLPEIDDAKEFGEEKPKAKDAAVIEDDAPVEEKAAEKHSKIDSEEKTEVKKIAVTKIEDDEASTTKKKSTKSHKEAAEIAEIEEEKEEAAEKKKTSHRKDVAKVPNFKKYQWPIIFGAIIAVFLFVFCFWALKIAPAMDVRVTIKTTPKNFNERVTFVTDEAKEDPDDGVFYIEGKSIKKTVKADFEATGKENKGNKASGTITITRPKGSVVTSEDDLTLSIPKGTVFTYNGRNYVTAEGGSANATTESLSCVGVFTRTCRLTEDISSGGIKIEASEKGENYNIEAASSGWSTNLGMPSNTKITSSAISGGTTKNVTVVSEDDIKDAESNLDMGIESEARDSLAEEFGDEYILISGSFKADDGKITTSPAKGEEVGKDVTPQITKELTYTIYAISRDDVERYVTKIIGEGIGDDTQKIHDSGASAAFVESFKQSDDKKSYTGKLKTTVQIGPNVTEQSVADRILGKRMGEVQAMLKSINGVTEVKTTPSYFWVTSVPEDINKVKIRICSSEDKCE